MAWIPERTHERRFLPSKRVGSNVSAGALKYDVEFILLVYWVLSFIRVDTAFF